MTFFYSFFSFCDVARAWQMEIQQPATPAIEGMIFFHHYLIFFIIVIGIFVFWLLFSALYYYNEETNKVVQIFSHSSILEIIWTIVPALILILIAVPSFALLYSLDELIDPRVTVKIIGHQWYWTYEYSDYLFMTQKGKRVGKLITLDSYMDPFSDLIKGNFRLLDTNWRLVLPSHTHVRLLITASDVIHSWYVPSFGIKVDACPGRLSQASVFIKRRGVFYGQCSEICGVNHGFMPIVVAVVQFKHFVPFVAQMMGAEHNLPKNLNRSYFK